MCDIRITNLRNNFGQRILLFIFCSFSGHILPKIGHIFPLKLPFIAFFCGKEYIMNLLGIDLGSSSVKIALIDGENGHQIATVSWPEKEMDILSPHPEWAEQNPEEWMDSIFHAIKQLKADFPTELKNAGAIGIAYQMHGLVAVDQEGKPVRNAIIWCDSRAVSVGNKAFDDLSPGFCLNHMLNSPGNFTASKLKWVKENEAEIYAKIHKIMLPGDYVAYRLTGRMQTTASGLSEGVFWDYQKNDISDELLQYYGFSRSILPEVVDTFSEQSFLSKEMAETLGLMPGIPVAYRAGDQPNNAFSLNVLNAGEIAATAGTSGVVYGVSDQKSHDPLSRVNTFLHVNNSRENPRLGILLCLNSVGILNSWVKHQFLPENITYKEMNALAQKVPAASEGLLVFPFGNGAERVLENKNIGATFQGMNLTLHRKEHVLRALQEGIAFAFQYGIEIMEEMGMQVSVIRAGKANMFLSSLFAQTLADLSGARIELYNTNGAVGAARAAGLGCGFYQNPDEAFVGLKVLNTIEPTKNQMIRETYHRWKEILQYQLNMNNY